MIAARNELARNELTELCPAQITRFLEEGCYAETTIALYRHYLEDLAVYLAAEGLPLDIAKARAWLRSRPWGASACYIAACALRAFARWQMGEHALSGFKVRRPKSRPQRTLTLDQVRSPLLAPNTGRTSGVRNLALVTFMLDTGFRAAEVCRLKLERLDLARRTAWVPVKGGDWGEGVFGDYTADCLEAWLAVRAKLARPGVTAVFVGCETSVGKPLTPGGLRSIFRKLGQTAGLGLISPHDMRRTFCTLALENGAPTRIVQEAGRWKSLEMVELYSRALRAHAIDPYSPVARAVKVKD